VEMINVGINCYICINYWEHHVMCWSGTPLKRKIEGEKKILLCLSPVLTYIWWLLLSHWINRKSVIQELMKTAWLATCWPILHPLRSLKM
jgi:hypothetical protein